MTRTSGRKQQETPTNRGPGSNPASTRSALLFKLSAPKIGAQGASAWTTPPPPALTAQDRGSGTTQGEAVIPPLKAGRSSKFVSSITSSMGIANLEKNAATFTFAVRAESPTPFPVAVREKTAAASATSEDLLACQIICSVIIYLMCCCLLITLPWPFHSSVKGHYGILITKSMCTRPPLLSISSPLPSLPLSFSLSFSLSLPLSLPPPPTSNSC